MHPGNLTEYVKYLLHPSTKNQVESSVRPLFPKENGVRGSSTLTGVDRAPPARTRRVRALPEPTGGPPGRCSRASAWKELGTPWDRDW